MSETRERRLDKAQVRVLFQVPFFAPAVARLPVIWDETVPTACTNGQCIRWNPAFFDSLHDQVLVTVLCHEACHCLLGHLWRLPPPGGDMLLANMAADHAVNLMLEEFSQLVKAKQLAEPFPFPKDMAICKDARFAGMSEEAIYAQLVSECQKQAYGKTSAVGQVSGKGGQPMSGQGNGTPNAPRASQGSKNARHDLPSLGEFESGSACSAKKLKTDWEGTFLQSVAAMKGQGELPAAIERLVAGLVSPQVDWWNVLRSWLREQSADDWDFLTPAMEYSTAEFILPSLRSDRMGDVVFATDTSGSIDLEMLARFQTEKQACLDEMKPRKLVDIYCDAKVQKVKEYDRGDLIDLDAPGGGGTSFIPVWQEVEKRGLTPKCLVYLTDLDGAFGDDPGYPVVFVTWTKDGKAPFGQVIYVGK